MKGKKKCVEDFSNHMLMPCNAGKQGEHWISQIAPQTAIKV